MTCTAALSNAAATSFMQAVMRTNYFAVDKTHRPAVHPGLPGTTSTSVMCCWAAGQRPPASPRLRLQTSLLPAQGCRDSAPAINSFARGCLRYHSSCRHDAACQSMTCLLPYTLLLLTAPPRWFMNLLPNGSTCPLLAAAQSTFWTASMQTPLSTPTPSRTLCSCHE